MAIRNGAKLLRCSTSAKVIWDMHEGDLPEGAEFAGAVTLFDMATDPQTVVVYF